MELLSPTKLSKRYQVINHDPAIDGVEYEIFVVEAEGYTSFRLVYKGSSWSDTLRDEIALRIDDNGNGVKVKPIGKSLDYSELSQLFILLSFMHHYQSGGLYCGTIRFTEIIKSVEL